MGLLRSDHGCGLPYDEMELCLLNGSDGNGNGP